MKNTIKMAVKLSCLLFILLQVKANAQAVAESLKQYPASVLSRVYEISSKANLPPRKQVALAQYFLKQDKLANTLLKSGDKLESISRCYTLDSAYLKTVLSPLEFNDYCYGIGKLRTQPVTALKYREQLNLTPVQINSLLALEAKVQSGQLTNTDGMSAARYEGVQLVQTLNDKQYDHLLELYVKPAAAEENKQSWAQLKMLGLVDHGENDPQFSVNQDYYLQAGIRDAKALNSNVYLRIDSVRGEYVAFKPFVLLKLDMINNLLPASQFAEVLRIRKDLKLTAPQTDSLVYNVRALEKARQAFKRNQPYKKYDATPFESKCLSRILDHGQYDAYLTTRNREKALTNEKKTWDRLKQYGLLQNVDSIKVARELADYELGKLVATERFHVDDSPQNADLRAKAEANKPIILKKLDVSIKTNALTTDPKKNLAW